MAYDIFISYRRKGAGAGVAGELQAKLENLGYKVFLDVDEIGSGQFPEQIERAISECKDFILVLSPGTLERCVEEEDWVRREILQAQNQNKNIIGVGLPGFIMPEAEALPDPLKPMTTIQVFAWTHEYRTASFEKIAENLVSTQVKKKKTHRLRLYLLSALLIIVAAVVVAAVTKKPSDTVEEVVETEQPQKEYQLYDYHAKKAIELTQDLPNSTEFKDNFLKLVSNAEPFEKLMKGIAECDSALNLREQSGSLIVDSYDIENQKIELLNLRQDYLSTILNDVKDMLDLDAAEMTRQDLEIADILALPEEKPMLDSIKAVVKHNSK
jgi:hypothetical protein